MKHGRQVTRQYATTVADVANHQIIDVLPTRSFVDVAAWIGQQLNAVGIKVVQASSVPDDTERILTSVAEAMRRAALVLITGGLGPTKDDITKKALSDFFGTDLVFNPDVYSDVKRFVQIRGIPENPLHRTQAMVPRSCTVVRNAIGTAPGMWFEKDGGIVVSMPGVPSEMRKMMQEAILPVLLSRFTPGVIVQRSVLVHGISESNLAVKIARWEVELPEGLKLASLPHGGFIHLRLTTSGENESALVELVEAERDKLSALIGEYIWDFSDRTPEALLNDILADRGATLALIECDPRGELAARICAVHGNRLAGAAIAPTIEAAARLSGTAPALLEDPGMVGAKAADLIAENLRIRLGATLAVATSAASATVSGKPGTLLWTAIASSGRTASISLPASGYYVDKILFALIRFLREQ